MKFFYKAGRVVESSWRELLSVISPQGETAMHLLFSVYIFCGTGKPVPYENKERKV